MKFRFFLFSVVLINMFFVNPAFSQQLVFFRGEILNTETGEPVVGANVVVSGTKTGTSSDAGGHFELRLHPGEYHLKISSVGFSGKEIAVSVNPGDQSPLRIGLIPKKLEIGNVDVIGRFTIADRDTSINRIPASLLTSVTRISAAEMEKQGAVTLMDALKFVPGGWTENRGRKTKQFFSVRGQKYPYPDYSINGVWQKEFEETGYFLSALDIESVEIVRSSSALVKGLSGLTGVVDVKTKKPEKETVSLLAKYGDLNQYVSHLQYGNKINDIAFTTSASLFGTDGPAGKNGKERIANFHGNFDWEINRKLGLSAGTTWIQGLRQLTNIDGEIGANNIKTRIDKYDPVRTLLSYAKLMYQADDGSSTELQTNVSWRNAGYSSYNIPQETTTSIQEKDWEYGMNVLHSRPLSPSNVLRFGALYNHWVAPEGKRFYVGRSCNVHTFSGVVASEQKVGKFMFDAGLRLISGYIEKWGGFGIEGSATGFQNVAPIENQMAPMEWQAVAGASYLLSPAASLHYNFSGGTIAPRKGSLTEAGETPETEGRFQHDLGIRFKTKNQDEIAVTAFFTRRNNAVDYSGGTVVTENNLVMELYENLDKRSYGVELSTKWNIPALHSFVFANGLLMKGEKESGGTMTDDVQLPNIILNGGWYFEWSRFDANLMINYTGPYTNNRFVNPNWVKQNGDFPLGDFVSGDLTAGYTFQGKYSKRIFAEVKNILDKKYMTVAGYPEVGRMFLAGVKINLNP